MPVVLLKYGLGGVVESMPGIAVRVRTLGAEVRVSAPPNCAEPLGTVDVPLLPIGVCR